MLAIEALIVDAGRAGRIVAFGTGLAHYVKCRMAGFRKVSKLEVIANHEIPAHIWAKLMRATDAVRFVPNHLRAGRVDYF